MMVPRIYQLSLIWIIHLNGILCDMDTGYFDIIDNMKVTAIVPAVGNVTPQESTEIGIFQCLSKCLCTEECWAVQISQVANQKTSRCLFYTLVQPPSNLITDTAGRPTSKLALRRWNDAVNVEERLAGTCTVYLLTGENSVPDENFSCSSWVYDYDGWVYHMAQYGRLNNNDLGAGAWCASEELTEPEWIQVFLGKIRQVTGIVTQGRTKDDTNYWVTSYRMTFSNDGQNWNNYTVGGVTRIFSGNVDGSTPVINMLEQPLYLAYVRIYPITSFDWMCLRIDLLGC